MNEYDISIKGTTTDIGEALLRQLSIPDLAELGRVLTDLAEMFAPA